MAERQELIHIKCSFEHQLRRMHFAASATFDEFLALLEHEYACPLVVEHETNEGQLVPISSAEAFAAMVASAAPLTPLKLRLGRRSIKTPRARLPADPLQRNVNDLFIDIDLVESAAAASRSANSGSLADVVAFMKNLTAELSPQEFETVGTIGHGAGGVVTAAVHRPTGRLMAVKRLPLEITSAAQKQVLSELEVLHDHRSDLIVGYHGAFFSSGAICICTEFMDCGSLDAVSRLAGPIPEGILSRVASAVVRGLAYLRTRFHLLHRDIKPSNILLSSSGQIKLCDFGVSGKLVHSLASTYVGTNAYMAPERINAAGDYNVRSDVWSLGISLIELATARSPFEQHKIAGVIDLLQVIVNHPSPRLPADGGFSEEFNSFVDACLLKSGTERPTPEELTKHPFTQPRNDGLDVAAWASQYRMERFIQYT